MDTAATAPHLGYHAGVPPSTPRPANDVALRSLPPLAGFDALAEWVRRQLPDELQVDVAGLLWQLSGRAVSDPLLRPLPVHIPLHQAHFGRVELVLDGEPDPHALSEWLPVLRERVAALLELEYLRTAVQQQQRAQQLSQALFAITELASSAKPMADVLAGLHAIIGGLMYAENFFIVRYNDSRDALRFLYFVDTVDEQALDGELPIAEMANSLTLAMMRSGRPQRGPSAKLTQSLGLVFEEHLGPDSEDWLGVPMLDGGEVVGALVVQSYRPDRRFSEDDEHLLLYVAQHVVTTLKRRETHQDLERRVLERTRALENEVHERERGEKLQSALFRITTLASRRGSMQAFYAGVHSIIGELLDARNFYIAEWDEASDELSFPYSVDERDLQRLPRKAGNGLTEHVLRSGEPLLATNMLSQELQAAGLIQRSGVPAACWLGLPLKIHDEVLGVIAVQSYSDPEAFGQREVSLLTFVAVHFAAAWERRRADFALQNAYRDLERRVAERTAELAALNASLRQNIDAREGVEAQLKHQALHDGLTGLPNRAYLLERLAEAIAKHQHDGRLYAVLFLDLDRFKVINDSEGHLVGDALLREAAKRVGECVRGHDTLARLGGDEFAILLERIGGPEDAMHVANRIVHSLGQPFEIDGKCLHSSASVGIALAQENYRQAEDVLRDADAAMYRAKAYGRKQYALFDEALRHEALQRLELERELRRALENNEFEPFYQPIVSLVNGAVLGYEALLRWRLPDGHYRPPLAFLPVAEEAGLLESIDWGMYRAACRDLAVLQPADAYVSLNLSPRLLAASDFAERFIALLDEHGVPGARICLEVTEGALIERPDLARAQMEQLARVGIKLVIDDFGTGYSSLSYLQMFPLSGLKIDRSFAVQLDAGGGAGSRPIIRAIVAMASSLDLTVVSEGIETEEQRQALYALGVRRAQGYLFGKPQPLAAYQGR